MGISSVLASITASYQQPASQSIGAGNSGGTNGAGNNFTQILNQAEGLSTSNGTQSPGQSNTASATSQLPGMSGHHHHHHSSQDSSLLAGNNSTGANSSSSGSLLDIFA